MKLKIGTRGSKLALWQSRRVQQDLANAGVASELTIIKTTGDLNQVKALDKIGDKGLFTKALDDSLLKGETDLSVHSSKDVPTIFILQIKHSIPISRINIA